MRRVIRLQSHRWGIRPSRLPSAGGEQAGGGRQELLGGGFRALERVASHDRPEAAAVTDGGDVVEHVLLARLRRASREDHEPAPREGCLDDVAYALGRRGNRDLPFLVYPLSFARCEP